MFFGLFFFFILLVVLYRQLFFVAMVGKSPIKELVLGKTPIAMETPVRALGRGFVPELQCKAAAAAQESANDDCPNVLFLNKKAAPKKKRR